MQLFILHSNPKVNATYYVDKHVNKILTEINQMLCTVNRKNTHVIPDFLYKSMHSKHPCTLWVGTCVENFVYALDTAEALYNEYQYRYNNPNKHIRNKKIIDFFKKYLPPLPLNRGRRSAFAQAIPQEYKSSNPVLSYRLYYIKEKKHLFNWTNRPVPNWILNYATKNTSYALDI